MVGQKNQYIGMNADILPTQGPSFRILQSPEPKLRVPVFWFLAQLTRHSSRSLHKTQSNVVLQIDKFQAKGALKEIGLAKVRPLRIRRTSP